MKEKMNYDFPNGYVHTHTEETITIINDKNRGRGRFKERFNVCLRDGKMTVVHSNVTKNELLRIKGEIEKQGNVLW